MSSASFYFFLKINYLISYPYAGCHSGQQTALLPLLPTLPASPVPSPVTAICRYVCHQLLHVTHSGAWNALPHDGNGVFPTDTLTSDKQLTVPSFLSCDGVRHPYQGPGRRQHNPKRDSHICHPDVPGHCLRALSSPVPIFAAVNQSLP